VNHLAPFSGGQTLTQGNNERQIANGIDDNEQRHKSQNKGLSPAHRSLLLLEIPFNGRTAWMDCQPNSNLVSTANIFYNE
jgi:hypothetical protein